MTPEIAKVAETVAGADEFFSCGASTVFAASTLPAVSDAQIAGLPIGNASSAGALGEQLTSLLQQIKDVTVRATELVSGRPEAVLAARPQPGRWSVAECFDHLARTTQAFLPPIHEAIAAAPAIRTNRRMRPGAVAGLLMRTLEPPYRLKHKVLAPLAPRHRDFPAAWSAFLHSQTHLSHAVLSAGGLALDEVKIKSPVSSRVSYNAYGALGILTAHQRRHFWQAEQALKAIGHAAA